MLSVPLMPCLFIFHGGGPMPLLGQQPDVAEFLQNYPTTIPRPSCILIVSAHWLTSNTIKVTSGSSHPLLYDYYDFPSESYNYKYPAPGSPGIAQSIYETLRNSNIPCELEEKRGWDHGVFVPLMLMYPDASIPVVEISLNKNLDPAFHINVGKAISALRQQGVLIVGSGASFHNFGYFFATDPETNRRGIEHSRVFNEFLVSTMVSPNKTLEEREALMVNWARASPSAREAHPEHGEEHLIPLHVVFGAGSQSPCREIGPVTPQSEIKFGYFEWR